MCVFSQCTSFNFVVEAYLYRHTHSHHIFERISEAQFLNPPTHQVRLVFLPLVSTNDAEKPPFLARVFSFTDEVYIARNDIVNFRYSNGF